MLELSINKLRIHNNKINGQVILDPSVAKSTSDEILKQEKEYQRLISEKLKSATEWHLRDSKLFSLG